MLHARRCDAAASPSRSVLCSSTPRPRNGADMRIGFGRRRATSRGAAGSRILAERRSGAPTVRCTSGGGCRPQWMLPDSARPFCCASVRTMDDDTTDWGLALALAARSWAHHAGPSLCRTPARPGRGARHGGTPRRAFGHWRYYGLCLGYALADQAAEAPPAVRGASSARPSADATSRFVGVASSTPGPRWDWGMPTGSCARSSGWWRDPAGVTPARLRLEPDVRPAPGRTTLRAAGHGE